MSLEFNKDGRIKLPKAVEEDIKRFNEKLKVAKNNPKKVYVDYDEIENGYEDEWTIILLNDIPKTILFKLKKWADKQHKIIGGNAWIEEEGKNEFILKVKGHENRYRWTHAFLNGLNTALIRDFGTMIKHKKTDKYNFHVDHSYDYY